MQARLALSVRGGREPAWPRPPGPRQMPPPAGFRPHAGANARTFGVGGGPKHRVRTAPNAHRGPDLLRGPISPDHERAADYTRHFQSVHELLAARAPASTWVGFEVANTANVEASWRRGCFPCGAGVETWGGLVAQVRVRGPRGGVDTEHGPPGRGVDSAGSPWLKLGQFAHVWALRRKKTR